MCMYMSMHSYMYMYMYMYSHLQRHLHLQKMLQTEEVCVFTFQRQRCSRYCNFQKHIDICKNVPLAEAGYPAEVEKAKGAP